MLNKKSFKNLGFNEVADLERFLAHEDIKTLIGDNYDHYKAVWLEKFNRVMSGTEKEKIKGRFNWLALLSYPVWAAYRKMYAQYITFVALMAALTFAEVYFDFSVPPGAFIGMFIVFAIMSKDIYLMNLVNHAKKLDKMDANEREKYIALRTGTSKLYAWLSLPVFIAVLAVSAILASTLSGNLW